jgi:centromere protein I
VGNVSVKAYGNGLPPDLLESLIDLITLPNHLDQASLGSIIRNLYPAGKVNDECVIKVVGCLGHGRTKPSFSAQAGLIKWLVMVYDVLENQKVLSQLYGVLFNLLDSLAIRLAITTATSTGRLLTILGLRYVICCPL